MSMSQACFGISPRPLPGNGRGTRAGLASVAVAATLLASSAAAQSAGLPERAATVKRSVIAVGTFMALRADRYRPLGTGFAVAPNHAVTNAHTLPTQLDRDRKESYALFVPAGEGRMDAREAQVVRRDETHDLALVRFTGAPLPALSLGRGADVREGQTVAFTGFPLVGALGFYPATHRGIVSAIAPVAIPAGSSRELKPEVLKRLGKPFDIFQLDATAYPGNSGSPLYDPDTGRVIGVVNSVFVKGSREAALTDPSGITYAIPVDHVRQLMSDAGLRP